MFFAAVFSIIAIMLALGLSAAGVIYMIRLGVQFGLGDLVVAVLVIGFPPAVGSMIAGRDRTAFAREVWACALALSVLVVIYQVYGFYWASIRPAPTPRARFWQRFGPSLTLTFGGIGALIWMALASTHLS